MVPAHGSTDAWILLSVLACGASGGDRAAVRAAADMINHSVPTDLECDGAEGRLVAQGWVALRAGVLVPTARAQAIYAQVSAGSPVWLRRRDALIEAMYANGTA